MRTKIKHIEKIRTEGILSPIWIQETFCLAEYDRKEFIFEQGMIFLKNRFEIDEESIKMHAYSRIYWKWWKATFLDWELELIRYITLAQPKITMEFYLMEMGVVAHDRITDDDFSCFLKITK
jgi:hypothetical protein